MQRDIWWHANKYGGKCTKPHPCIFFTLEYNCSVKRCRDIGLCIFTSTQFTSFLPCLHTFWHAPIFLFLCFYCYSETYKHKNSFKCNHTDTRTLTADKKREPLSIRGF